MKLEKCKRDNSDTSTDTTNLNKKANGSNISIGIIDVDRVSDNSDIDISKDRYKQKNK